MSALRLLAVAAALLVSSAAQAEGTVKLYCAVNATGFFDAEMQLREQGPNLVNVTFIRTQPSKVVVDWALRDCLKTAVKLDGSRDIVGFAWFRSGANAALELLRKTLTAR
jgi:hypothetical protein